MSAFKEFANFITLNMANLAVTYAELLEENGGGYENIPADRRTASARRLLKSVIEAYELETSDSLCRLFDGHVDEGPQRWAKDIAPPQPILEVECLGQTLVPVVTNLEAGKFLWQILSEARTTVFQAIEKVPPAQVQTSTEVAQEIAAAPTLDDLFRRVVNLVQTRFGYYYVHIYTLEENDLVMQKGTGEAGRQMKEAGHKIALSAEQSLIARAARSGEPVLVPDVSQEPAWLPHPLLPKAGSELAVPIQLGDKVLGVLDVKNDTVGSLDEEDQFLLLGLCGQIAIAIDNRRIETEREQAQVVLLESEQKYKEFVDNLPVGIYRSVPGPKGRFLEGNPAIMEMFGIGSKEEFFKLEVSQLFLDSARRGEVSQKILKFGFIKNEEVRLKTVTGRPLWGVLNAVLKEDANGQPCFEGVVQDITERKLAEEALRKSEERFALAMRGSNDGLWDWDIENDTLYWSPLVKEQLGYADDELKVDFSTFETLLHPDDKERSEAALEAHLKDRVPYDVEQRFLAKGGEYRWFRERGQAIWDEDGRPLRMVGSSTDITERKQAEEMLAKLATELETVAQVSAATSTILDTQKLLRNVVDLTKDRFGLYHVHVYLLDQAGDTLELAAGAGETGQQMVAEGWHISLTQEQSLVAQTARTRQGVIVNNVREHPGWLPNPLLPDTRSELAVPLIVSNRVLGVLDVQADEVNYFTEEDVHVQTVLATQVGIALQNANLYRQMQEVLEETLVLPQFSQTLAETLEVAKILDVFLETCTEEIGFEYIQLALVDKDRNRIKTIADVGLDENNFKPVDRSLDSADIWASVIKTGETEVITGWDKRLDQESFETEDHADWVRVYAPVTLRQENIGVIEGGFHKKDQARVKDAQIRLLGALIDQTALALDNAQRYEATQKTARREQAIRQITEKMRAATSLDELVKTAAEELGERLSAGHVVVELGIEQ